MLLDEAIRSRARIINIDERSIYRHSDVTKPFEWYAYPKETMEMVERTRQWYRTRGWYSSKHIPWRRGWLLHGPAGTGKTVLAKSMAQDLNMPIFVFDIASMDNEEFEKFWREAQSQNPCMVLVEDFDAVFHKRENVIETSSQKLTFDCLLNCVSGIEPSDGILLVITTNYVEHIDASLGVTDGSMSTRPGRIDDVLRFGPMEEGCRRIMAVRILGATGDMLEKAVAQTNGMSPAQFTEYCNRKASQMSAASSEGQCAAAGVLTHVRA
jgi:SpoVK/Ycf46/Vps4 family AAA+-type ATPase